MNLDTERMLDFLNNSTDKKVELDKDFFISIIKLIDNTENIKVEELYNNNRAVFTDGKTTIINRAELLSETSKFSKLNGEVKVDVVELKAILKDNQKMITQIKELHGLKDRLEKQISMMLTNNKFEREHRRVSNPYDNSMGEDIKISLRG